MIDIQNLTKRFGTCEAVSSLSLNVAAGEIYALLGPNGAGKSTTIACTLGFLAPDSGTIKLADSPLPTAQAAIHYAAYIAENVALYEKLTGIENVEFFVRLCGGQPQRNALETLLDHAGVPRHAWHRRAETYSKGMRQKVGVVMALAKGARILVLDEPTSGLDPHASMEFGLLMKNLAASGTTILMATHDLFRAQELATHCGMMVDGRLAGEWKLAGLQTGELERNYLATLERSAHHE